MSDIYPSTSLSDAQQSNVTVRPSTVQHSCPILGIPVFLSDSQQSYIFVRYPTVQHSCPIPYPTVQHSCPTLSNPAFLFSTRESTSSSDTQQSFLSHTHQSDPPVPHPAVIFVPYSAALLSHIQQLLLSHTQQSYTPVPHPAVTFVPYSAVGHSCPTPSSHFCPIFSSRTLLSHTQQFCSWMTANGNLSL